MLQKVNRDTKQQIRFVGAAALVFALIFVCLLLIRLDFFTSAKKRSVPPSISPNPQRDTWMNIFQNGRKIGYSHSTFQPTDEGYAVSETLFVRINTMGLVQDVHLKTSGRLKPDLSLSSFAFTIQSARFSFTAEGVVSGNQISLVTRDAGGSARHTIPFKNPPYLTIGLIPKISATPLSEGEIVTIDLFDPATLGEMPVVICGLGKEEIRVGKEIINARKVSLRFKGATQYAWLDEAGGIIKEKGILGLTLEKTTQKDALYGMTIASSQDLTAVASIRSNIKLTHPEHIHKLTLEVGHVEMEKLSLNGGRQVFKAPLLTITRESVKEISVNNPDAGGSDLAPYLKPSPFIASDDEKIKNLVRSLISSQDHPFRRVEKLMVWIRDHIEKRPVVSVPDALATLENRVGDCNEHAVLMAALARAAGVPAKVETGLVYLKGRFYYHAWNAVYLDRWITVDSLFGQFPADVTHIRLAQGEQNQQLDLMGVIGQIELKVLDYEPKDAFDD